MRRITWILIPVLLLALMGIFTFPASAHAVLVNSNPADNATLTSAPSQVDLYFSEAIDPNLSKLSVMDAKGQQVDAHDAHLDPADATHLLVSLPKLSDGVFTVMWAAVSATDGHQTTGSFPFAVGSVAAGAMSMAQTPTTSSSFDVGIIASKVLLYIPTAAIIGAIMFSIIVWKPSLQQASLEADDLPNYARFIQKLLLGAFLLLIIADLLSLFTQAGQVSGRLIGWPWQPDFKTILLNTRFGILVLARLALVFVLAGLLLPRPRRINRYLALALIPLLLLTFTLESHAAAEPQPILPILSDWIHFAAISVWVGGLISFFGAMASINKLAPDTRTNLTAILIPHFTLLAMSSVGFLALTGVYSAFLRIGQLGSLIDTTYGRVLLVKLAFLAPMLALGGFHFLVTTPLMRRAAKRSNGSLVLVRLFRRLLTGELVLGMLVLILVGVLTTLPPARAVGTFAGYSRSTKVADLKVSLTIDPGRAGMNTFTARITSNGQPVIDAKDVSLEFSTQSGMMTASKAAMADMGKGVYTLRGGYLGMPDQWDVKVVVRRPGKFDAYAGFSVTISQAISRTISWQPLSLGLMVFSVIGLAFFIVMVTRSPAREWRWA